MLYFVTNIFVQKHLVFIDKKNKISLIFNLQLAIHLLK